MNAKFDKHAFNKPNKLKLKKNIFNVCTKNKIYNKLISIKIILKC
jgi:hypothetical protein